MNRYRIFVLFVLLPVLFGTLLPTTGSIPCWIDASRALSAYLPFRATLAYGGELHEGDGLAEDAQPPFPGHGYIGAALSRRDEGPILDMNSRGVALLSWLSLQDLPGGSTRASDIWGYVSPAGREYAVIGLERGTAFIDISDPVNPVIAGHVVSPTSIWKEVTTYDQYAYVVTEAGGGMQVIDLHQIDQHQVALIGTVTTQGLDRTHTIRVNPATGFLYLNGSNLYNGGLIAFNVANPASPQFAGAWNTT